MDEAEDFHAAAFVEDAIERGHTKHSGSITISYADGHVDMLQVPEQAHWIEQLAKRSGELDVDSLEIREFPSNELVGTSISGWLLFLLCLMPAATMTRWYIERKRAAKISELIQACRDSN